MSVDVGSIVVGHALETTRNLSTALQVGAQYDAIRFGVMERVLRRLKGSVQAASIGGRWEAEYGGGMPEADEDLFWLNRPDLGSELYSGLCPWAAEAQTVSYFVYVGVDTTPDIEGEIAILRSTLTREMGRGRKSSGCPWFKSLDAPFDDWGDTDNLVQLYEDVSVSEGIADRLIHLTTVAEPHLERIAALAGMSSDSGSEANE